MKAKKKSTKQYRVISNTHHIAGLQYYDYAPGLLEKGRIEVELDLYTEPTNAYDKKAIVIKFGQYKLGYVPKMLNDQLYTEKMAGGKVTAFAILHDTEHPLWQRILVEYRTDRLEQLERF